MNENEEEQWTSYSKINISNLAPWISKQLDILGVKSALGSGLYETYIQGSGFNIRFHETNYGCELSVYIFKKNEEAITLHALWKHIVNKDIVWGGRYSKDLSTENTTSKNDDTKEQEEQVPPLYAADLEAVRKLSMEGLTIPQIATRLSRSISSIKRYRKILGIKRRKK